MSHDRGCFRCGDDYDSYCRRADCPRRDKMSDTEECPVCHGKGSYIEQGDAHRSTGSVPCNRCNQTGRVPVERKVPRYDDKGTKLAEMLRETLMKGKVQTKVVDTYVKPTRQALETDSGDEFLEYLDEIAQEDAVGLREAQRSYGNSWKSRGGVGAYMMLARKWDRLENRVKREPSYDIFAHIASDERAEGVIDDVRDLRRYLLLVEAELRARGFKATHRDNR